MEAAETRLPSLCAVEGLFRSRAGAAGESEDRGTPDIPRSLPHTLEQDLLRERLALHTSLEQITHHVLAGSPAATLQHLAQVLLHLRHGAPALLQQRDISGLGDADGDDVIRPLLEARVQRGIQPQQRANDTGGQRQGELVDEVHRAALEDASGEILGDGTDARLEPARAVGPKARLTRPRRRPCVLGSSMKTSESARGLERPNQGGSAASRKPSDEKSFGFLKTWRTSSYRLTAHSPPGSTWDTGALRRI